MNTLLDHCRNNENLKQLDYFMQQTTKTKSEKGETSYVQIMKPIIV